MWSRKFKTEWNYCYTLLVASRNRRGARRPTANTFEFSPFFQRKAENRVDWKIAR